MAVWFTMLLHNVDAQHVPRYVMGFEDLTPITLWSVPDVGGIPLHFPRTQLALDEVLDTFTHVVTT
eukprot:1777351-Amphidinium_carterae.1